MPKFDEAVVERTPATKAECPANEYGDTHCWHWLSRPPTLQTRALADCCWCGTIQGFTYEDVLSGRVPVSPSPAPVHVMVRCSRDDPTFYALRDHVRKLTGDT